MTRLFQKAKISIAASAGPERIDPLLGNEAGIDKVTRKEHLQRYEDASTKTHNSIVLDLGCGTGYGSGLLYKHQNTVYALDISLDALSYAKQHYPGPEYIQGSAERLPFDHNRFNAITCFEVIEHVNNPHSVLSEIRRILRPNGDLFISTPNPRHLGNVLNHIIRGKPYSAKANEDNPYHIKEFYYEEFMHLLRNMGFTIRSKYGQTIPEIPSFQGLLPDAGRFLPKYARILVVHCIKEDIL